MGNTLIYRIPAQRPMSRIAVVLLAGMICGTAQAVTAEYQIRRIVYLKTSCGLESLVTLEASSGRERFKATCNNISAYPKGLEIICTDPVDDRSCMITTRAVRFDQLQLMRPTN
ncbi:conserved exported hypothetical protein [Hyphomicrobium sp. GJ21]|nr:conserved exported hypothetical protein [Hyphomicrobium sp. GJ21]